MAGTDIATDLVSVVTADHRAVEKVFAELENGRQSPDRRRELADHVTAELVRHAVAEEQYLYPTARKALKDGDELVDRDIAEHERAERTMKDLERLPPENPRFEELLRDLISTMRHHFQDEESTLLPRLNAACTPDELRELGEKVLHAKKMAPTHPHPAAPDRPPANRLLTPGVAFIDKIRDALTDRSP